MAKKKKAPSHYVTEDGIIRKLEKELKALDRCQNCGAINGGHFPGCITRKHR